MRGSAPGKHTFTMSLVVIVCCHSLSVERKQASKGHLPSETTLGGGGGCQDTERTQPKQGVLPSGDSKGRDESRHRRKVLSERHSWARDCKRRDKSGKGTKLNE